MWAATAIYALLATAAICWPVWPGHMHHDGLYAWARSIAGVEHMTWPPMHTYLYWVSRRLGAGPGGLFAFQTFLLFGAVGIVASVLVRSRAWALAAMAAFALAFPAIPPMLGAALSHWRDVITTSFALAAVALWLLAARRRSNGLLAAAALALGVSLSLRYNAFPLFALIAPMMAWRPFLTARASMRERAFAAVLLVLAGGLAWASTQWRLPDLQRMPATKGFAQVQLFDLLGMSACTDRNLLPPAVTGGAPITALQIRQAYDPRHVQRAHRPVAGAPPILATDGGGAVQRAWREAVPQHFGCYLDHRRMVMVHQLGLAKGEVFYPVHGGVDANPFGFQLARPPASRWVTDYVARNAPEPWRRPALLYVCVLPVLGLLALRRDHRTPALLALVAGAYANVALLAVIAPAADARYIFPSNVFCALVIAVGVAALLEGGPGRPHGRSRAGASG